jgi:hypothetical protein
MSILISWEKFLKDIDFGPKFVVEYKLDSNNRRSWGKGLYNGNGGSNCYDSGPY